MNVQKMKNLLSRGKVYDLGMEYYVGMPHHPNHPPFAFSLTKVHGDVVYEGGVSACNCLFTTGGHTGTHKVYKSKKGIRSYCGRDGSVTFMIRANTILTRAVRG